MSIWNLPLLSTTILFISDWPSRLTDKSLLYIYLDLWKPGRPRNPYWPWFSFVLRCVFPHLFFFVFLIFWGEGDYGAESEIVLTFDQAEDLVKSLLFVITILVLLQNKRTTFEKIKFFAFFFGVSLRRNVLNPVRIPTLCETLLKKTYHQWYKDIKRKKIRDVKLVRRRNQPQF